MNTPTIFSTSLNITRIAYPVSIFICPVSAWFTFTLPWPLRPALGRPPLRPAAEQSTAAGLASASAWSASATASRTAPISATNLQTAPVRTRKCGYRNLDSRPRCSLQRDLSRRGGQNLRAGGETSLRAAAALPLLPELHGGRRPPRRARPADVRVLRRRHLRVVHDRGLSRRFHIDKGGQQTGIVGQVVRKRLGLHGVLQRDFQRERHVEVGQAAAAGRFFFCNCSVT